MSITLLTGVPGSGKSYFAMDYICNKLKTREEFLIVSNIEGTDKLIYDRRYVYCEYTADMLKNANMVVYLTDLRRAHNIHESTMIYFFIDEAQKYYGPSCRDDDMFFFLDYHRHYGIDIFLITQKDTKVRKEVEALCETEIRGVPPSLGIVPGYFVYNHKCGGEVFDKIRVKKRAEVFACYKSFQAGKVKRASYSMYLRILVPLIIAIVAGYYSFHTLQGGAKKKPEPAKEVATTSQQQVKTDEKKSDSVSTPIVVKKTPEYKFDELEAKVSEYVEILEYSNYEVTLKDKILGTVVKMSFWDFINKYPPIELEFQYIITKDVLMIVVSHGKRLLEFRNDLASVGVSRDPTIMSVGKKTM